MVMLDLVKMDQTSRCALQANLKQLIEAVRKNDVNKASRLTMKGVDPNFIDADIGGTWSCL